MPVTRAPETQSAGEPDAPELAADALFRGPARFRAVTPWGPFEASAMMLVAAGGPAILAAPIVVALAWAGFQVQEMTTASPTVLALMAATQLMSIALIWLLAGRANMRPDTLQFRQPPLSLLGCLLAGAIVVVLTSLLELFMHKIVGFDPFAETKILSDGLKSPYWLGVVVVAVVLAPIWEELAFRGFLLTALAKTRLGIVGAGLICNSVWTVMHLQYSPAGMASVFLAGALLTWIVWRTGSIRAAIVTHGVVNATSLAFIAALSPA